MLVFFTDTECKVTNVVIDEYIECTVAADPEYMTSNFEGKIFIYFSIFYEDLYFRIFLPH